MKHLFALVLVFSFITSSAFAIQWCEIEILDAQGNLLRSKVSERGEKFGNREVKKLYDCDTCWNGGKYLGPRSDYCGINNGAGYEYKVTCMKNSGAVKKKIYDCP